MKKECLILLYHKDEHERLFNLINEYYEHSLGESHEKWIRIYIKYVNKIRECMYNWGEK